MTQAEQPTIGVRFIVEITGDGQYQIGSAVMSEQNWRTELPDALRMLANEHLVADDVVQAGEAS
jgi:hypothetical protein